MRSLHSLLAAAALGLCVGAHADTWRFDAKARTQSFVHGAVRAVVTIDGRGNQQYPRVQFEVFNAGRRVALVPGVAVEQVFASPDNKLFVGLSNSGVPATAVVVFSAQGEVRLLASHGLAEFDYCDRSVTIQRVWYDSSNPNVRFITDGPREGQGIFLRSCRGQDIELVQVVQQAFARATNRK